MTPGDVIGGRFEIEREAASGGMSRVFAARDRQTGARVAVKVVREGVALARFEQEAKLLAELSLPGVVKYVACGVIDGGAYLVLEWLDGADLQRELSERGLTIHQSLVVAEQVARTLAALHAREIVHRDIKPSNVFLVAGDPARATLVDFGIAQAVLDGAATTAPGLGTPAYMCPEQASGQRDIDSRSDVFSLGCVLFACLAGRPPFRGDGLATLLEAPRLRVVRPEIPEPVAALVARMMSQTRDDRPSADEVVRAIAALAPVQASRPRRLRPTIGASEQRVVTILAWAGTSADERARAIGASANVIAESDGLAIAAFAGDGNAVQQTTRAASLALRTGSAPIVLCTGRAVMRGGLPAGEVLDRARRHAAGAVERGVVADAPTVALLEDRFDGVDVGGHLFALTSELPHAPGTRTLLARRAPFCGRDREVAALTALYDEVVAEASARIALVTGAAGFGKSRLVDELAAVVRARGDTEVLIERAEPHASHDPAVALDRLPALASRGPVVLVLEDLQWHHRDVAKQVDGLLRGLRNLPVLVIGTGRPEIRAILPALWAERGLYEQALGALSHKASAQIARAVLGDGDRADEIARHGEGNPLMLEALLLPDVAATIDGVLAALEPRLDRLEPAARRALRVASWFGRTFPGEGLAALLGEDPRESLAMLEEHNLVHPGGPPTEYTFVNPVIRDAMFATLTDDDCAVAQRVALEDAIEQ